MPRPCFTNHPTPQPETCRLCYLDANDPAYRAEWAKNGSGDNGLSPAARCPFTGAEARDETGNQKFKECQPCRGKVRLKVFQCLNPARQPEEVTNEDCKVCPHRPRDTSKATRLLLKNHLSPGDVLVMSAAVYSLHKAHPGKFTTTVDTSCPSVWDFNPDVTSGDNPLSPEPRVVEMRYDLVNESNQRAVSMLEGYCRHLEATLGISVPLLTNRPHVYLSNQEKGWRSQVVDVTGRDQKFWLICAGWKDCFPAKWWPYYQEVVDRLRGKILFVQVGKAEHHHPPLKGVLDFRGKTDDRQLIRLAHHAQGVLCGVTFPMHLAAALGRPAVVIAGGREPRSWNTYPRQTLLSNVGTLPCCSETACWRSKVVKQPGDKDGESYCDFPLPTEPPTPKCMSLISPAQVCEAIESYYDGGVLSYGN